MAKIPHVHHKSSQSRGKRTAALAWLAADSLLLGPGSCLLLTQDHCWFRHDSSLGYKWCVIFRGQLCFLVVFQSWKAAWLYQKSELGIKNNPTFLQASS